MLAAAAGAAPGPPAGAAAHRRTAASTAPPHHRAARAVVGCRRHPPPTPVAATPVAGTPDDWTVVSFDGTPIRAHWFPVSPTTRHPTVLIGPGWGQAGENDPTAAATEGGVTIDDLRAAGYNVLTWDPRGFGQSGGSVELDSTAYEARDVSVLLDWIATLPDVALDAPGDPRVGMVGSSYGGGIQFAAASIDCRIDVIVPTIAWHSLVTSLDTDNTYKSGWAGLLYAAAPAHVDPHITHAHAVATATGVLDPADRSWFAARGSHVTRVRVPTLVIQGTVDTLFPLEEGIANYESLRARGVPTAMLWFCGGHGICLTEPGPSSAVRRATMAWLARYLKRERSVQTGPGFSFVDQNGATYTAPSYPVPLGAPLVGTGHGTLTLVAQGGSGPAHVPASTAGAGLLGAVAGAVTPARATHAVNVPVSAGGRHAVVVGAPRLTLTYRGRAPAGSRPERVFAQVVDDATGKVLGNQVTPVPVHLNGRVHTVSLPLEVVAFTATPGARLTLQLVATTVAYAVPRLGGTVAFSRITVSLPVAAHLHAR